MVLTQNKKTILLIFIAFIFSLTVRLFWVQEFSDTEQYKFNGEFMINTNDGYYWAEGARDILAGKTENTNDLSPLQNAAPKLTAWLVKILPFSFETIIFYMPAFFSSLIVIPILLIAREFDKEEAGFIAALVGSIAWSYYNRTMVGYYDTDFLNILFPTILLWSLIWALKSSQEKYFLIAALDSIAYRWWYPQSYSLEFAFIVLIALFIAYQIKKREPFQTNLLLISFLLLAMLNLDGWIRLMSVLTLSLVLHFKKELVFKYIYYIFAFSVVLFLIAGGLDPIIEKLKSYVFRDTVSATEGLGLHFYTVMQTIREAGSIPFDTFANRISGQTITFILSLVGYIWFVRRHPIMLLALPMLGLGFLAYGIPGLIAPAGLRFTVYAVPVMALGLGFLIYEVSKYLSSRLVQDFAVKRFQYMLMSVFTALALYPNLDHVQEYKVPTVFTKNEVEVLDQLKSIADREDYVVTWWDYGYPIRYYSDVKTLADGGKHSGAVNFPLSYILNSPIKEAAKMARLDVEYTEKRFALREVNNTTFASSNIEQMTVDYGFTDPNDFLLSLQADLKLPEKTRDIYLYLPNRMMSIFPTVSLFSNLDLMTGEKFKKPFFYSTAYIQDTGKIIELGNNVRISKEKGELQIGDQSVLINRFIVTAYDKEQKLQVSSQLLHHDAPMYVIFMKDYNQFVILDKKMYNSSFIQMFVLEKYDPSLFEPVIIHPLAKIYKLKI